MNIKNNTSNTRSLPRSIDPALTFDALVNYVYNDIIVQKGATGFMVGLSGTDSILAFLICAKAAEKANEEGKSIQVKGVHFVTPPTPTEHASNEVDIPALGVRYATKETVASFLSPLQDALTNLQATPVAQHNDGASWFQTDIIPWLKTKAPQATIVVDEHPLNSMDGVRWGKMLDGSAAEKMWVVGTHNATEKALMNYSNASMNVSLQPIDTLYKSEVLELCKYLGVPEIASAKSCQVDCACGRFELPALHIPQVDALLMEQEDILSSEYSKQNIPEHLRTQLLAFIEGQQRAARFKKEIPYRADANTIIQLGTQPQHYDAAKRAISGEGDIQDISSAVPEIIHQQHANAACDLVCTPSSNRSAWLPEALTLLNTPNLNLAQKQNMVQHVFGLSKTPTVGITNPLVKDSARLGNYGFSFPRWRFVTQSGNNTPALVEHFGMEKLKRHNDVRDPTLPDPARDELGAGFVWNNEQWYVEYRRAYLVCSNLSQENPATIVIRNNSHFFGRDRLPEPVYVSFEPMTPEQLQALDANTLEQSGQFVKWQDIAKEGDDNDLKDRLKRIRTTLDYLDGFDRNLHQWLCSSGPSQPAAAGPDHSSSSERGGIHALQEFLKGKLEQTKTGTPPLFLARVATGAPSWFPEQTTPVDASLFDTFPSPLTEGSNTHQLVLMTGANGDFPVFKKKDTKQPDGIVSNIRVNSSAITNDGHSPE